MSFSTRVGLLAGATALTLTGVSHAGQGNDDMAQRLAAAEAKISAMEAAQNQNWLTEQRAEEIKGLVQDVLADADTRASLLQSGATSGYDNGFIIGSSDGNWLLRFNMLMQQRFIWNHADETALVAFDADRRGFENTRTKLILSGHIVDPSWTFKWSNNFGSPSAVNAADARGGTGEAWIGHDCGNGWSMKVGTMKSPLLREELVDAQYQLAVERSNFNYIFTNGYADGLSVSYDGDQFRATAMFSDGGRTGQTVWALGPPLQSEFAITARGEFLASGTWDQFKDFTADVNNTANGIMIGAAVSYQKSEYGTSTPFSPEMETLVLTADASVEIGQFNLFAAFAWTDIQNFGGVAPAGGIAADVNPWGFVVQGGMTFATDWEGFIRYEFTDYDAQSTGPLAFAPGTAPDDLSIITFGVNKYFHGHNAKWTTDVGYSFGTLGTIGAGAGFAGPAAITGFRADSGAGTAAGQDGQVVVRTQLQLYF